MVASAAFESAEALASYLQENAGPYRVSIGQPNSADVSFTGQGVADLAYLDQTVTFESATSVVSLNSELAKHGQTVPIIDCHLTDKTMAFGQLMAINLPIPGQSVFGTYRDWVLGITVVLASGEIVQCGSKAVKSVAGYDLHKLFIGARHTLGVVASVTMRTFPLASFHATKLNLQAGKEAEPTWIQRTRRSDFTAAVLNAGDFLVLADHDSCTLWANPEQPLQRFAYDWVIDKGSPLINNLQERELMIQMKNKLDPKHKLNPGEFGFL